MQNNTSYNAELGKSIINGKLAASNRPLSNGLPNVEHGSAAYSPVVRLARQRLRFNSSPEEATKEDPQALLVYAIDELDAQGEPIRTDVYAKTNAYDVLLRSYTESGNGLIITELFDRSQVWPGVGQSTTEDWHGNYSYASLNTNLGFALEPGTLARHQPYSIVTIGRLSGVSLSTIIADDDGSLGQGQNALTVSNNLACAGTYIGLADNSGSMAQRNFILGDTKNWQGLYTSYRAEWGIFANGDIEADPLYSYDFGPEFGALPTGQTQALTDVPNSGTPFVDRSFTEPLEFDLPVAYNYPTALCFVATSIAPGQGSPANQYNSDITSELELKHMPGGRGSFNPETGRAIVQIEHYLPGSPPLPQLDYFVIEANGDFTFSTVAKPNLPVVDVDDLAPFWLDGSATNALGEKLTPEPRPDRSYIASTNTLIDFTTEPTLASLQAGGSIVFTQQGEQIALPSLTSTATRLIGIYA